MAGDAQAFPTTVGMNRLSDEYSINCAGVPHDRGDEPLVGIAFDKKISRSPRPWG